MSFQEEVFIPLMRAESNNLVDFLATSGGLFGLYLGASVLSFFEIVYYLILRIFFLRRQEQRTIQETLNNRSQIIAY